MPRVVCLRSKNRRHAIRKTQIAIVMGILGADGRVLGVANWLYLGADLVWRVWRVRVSIDGFSKESVLRLFQARWWGREGTINVGAALLEALKR